MRDGGVSGAPNDIENVDGVFSLGGCVGAGAGAGFGGTVPLTRGENGGVRVRTDDIGAGGGVAGLGVAAGGGGAGVFALVGAIGGAFGSALGMGGGHAVDAPAPA